MEDTLALANPSAIHPIRQGFPPPIFSRERRAEVIEHLRFFAMCYASGFIAVYAFIA